MAKASSSYFGTLRSYGFKTCSISRRMFRLFWIWCTFAISILLQLWWCGTQFLHGNSGGYFKGPLQRVCQVVLKDIIKIIFRTSSWKFIYFFYTVNWDMFFFIFNHFLKTLRIMCHHLAFQSLQNLHFY